MAAARPRILCVDDDPSMLGGLSAVLRREFEVRTAASGPDGLRILAEDGHFVVVVSDLAMPGMSGVEFMALVRTVAPNAVRMLLTGHASLEAAVAAVNEGNIFRFLVKPCRPDELIKALNDGVEQARLVTADCELLERRLEAMSGHLLRAERLASLGTLAGAVGHELNNLLTTFDCALGLVVEEAEQGRVPGATYLAALAQVQEGLAVHARNLLQLGRPQPTTGTATELRTALEGALASLRQAGVLRRVRIDLDLPRDPMTARISRVEFEQVITNLVRNAVDACIETMDAEPTLHIRLRQTPAATVVCTVSDNGHGIPANQVPLLFEPYFTTKSPDRGTGLGLFVVNSVVRKAGGAVSVDSTAGRGTTIEFSLPLA